MCTSIAGLGHKDPARELNLKVAILAGGLGTRLAEETEIRPKPMVEIGGKPILWHIMMHYARYGHDEFVIALGYKGEYIKRWMLEYSTLWGDMTVQTGTGKTTRHAPTRKMPTGPSTSWTRARHPRPAAASSGSSHGSTASASC